MPLIVQKYGGSSLASHECIRHVARRVAKAAQTASVVVVVSAMKGETDALIRQAHDMSLTPVPQAYDALLALGEQRSAALLAMALHGVGCTAISMTGGRAGVHTTSVHGQADITTIDTTAIRRAHRHYDVVVVTGFQGVNAKGDVTTLGRGGSDMTAVVLAGELHAQACQIFTDVDGVLTADPSVVLTAQCHHTLSLESMQALSRAGAKVMQERALDYCIRHDLGFYVRSTFSEATGTWVDPRAVPKKGEWVGIASKKNQCLMVVEGIQQGDAFVLEGRKRIQEQNRQESGWIMSHHVGHQHPVVYGQFSEAYYQWAVLMMNQLLDDWGEGHLLEKRLVAEVSLVSHGNEQHSQDVMQVMTVLAKNDIPLYFIRSSARRVVLLLDQQVHDQAVSLLHDRLIAQQRKSFLLADA